MSKNLGLMKSQNQKMVEIFMMLAKQDLPETPVIPLETIRRLRARLILEEVFETIRGFGFDVVATDAVGNETIVNLVPLEFQSNYTPCLTEIVDGCMDIGVVTTGTLSACGVPDLPFMEAVNQNNIEKFKPGHTWREDGKLIKPPGHKPPDLLGILQEFGYNRP